MKLVSRRVFLTVAGAFAAGAYFFGRLFKPKARNPAAVPTDTKIKRAAIHPGIGVARIGNSATEFFIGPEVTDPPPTEAGHSRDSLGALKRQAARFRLYGYNASGELVGEITPSERVKIEWTVHVANKKAAWYRFIMALDQDEVRDSRSIKRNAAVADRKTLVIDPGIKKISGIRSQAVPLSGGKFKSTHVSLGELRTDEAGRLLVLGGLGKSASPSGAPVYTPPPPGAPDDAPEYDTFNNADDWYDDTSDGPVHASVSIDGESVPVDGAWVVVAPPNYAPDTVSWRTMYDLLVDTYIKSGVMPQPAETKFHKDILPLLRRLAKLGWVNKGFADTFLKGTHFDFENPQTVQILMQSPTALQGTREERLTIAKIYDSFRLAEKGETVKKFDLWPMLYGDAYGAFPNSLNQNLIVPPLQTLHLSRWVRGECTIETTPPPIHTDFAQVPLAEQPAMLDQAALHFCLADAFHPGCELTWPMRHMSLYRAPFRIKERDANTAEPDYGDKLTREIALAADGPVNAQGPGDLTKWMAIPWQGDTVMCRSGYNYELNPFLPSFWPARVPNQVLTEDDYKIVMDTDRSREERIEAFNRRESWVRNLRGSGPQQIMQMVAQFDESGVVETRKGIPNDPFFPEVMLVESLPRRAATRGLEFGMPKAAGARAMPDANNPAVKAGFESEEQAREFRRMRFR